MNIDERPTLDDAAQALLFTEARSNKFFADRAVPEATLRQLYEIARFAPTASNTCPMRLVFVTSEQEKERLSATLMPGNVDKVASAPVVVIVAYDVEFYEALPQLAPHMNYPSKYASESRVAIYEVALRNSSIQAGFLILAARAFGLDCGPMSGFRQPALDKAFFDGTTWRANFLMNLGYGTGERLHDRAQRLSFEQACQIR